MKSIHKRSKQTGTFLFYLLWPLVWFYAPLKLRVRVVILVDKEVLVVKNWFGPNVWQLPGGGVKFGEVVIDTAVREIKEELGLILSRQQVATLMDNAVVVRKYGLLFRYMYVKVVLDSKPKIIKSNEVTDHSWIPLEDLEIPDSVKSHLL